MDEKLKKRLVGAIVLVSLVVIFVPMLLEEEPVLNTGIIKSNIPPRPAEGFSSRILSEDTGPAPAAEPERAADSAETIADAMPGAVAGKTPTPRVGLSAWVIQVASFGQRENADKLVESLRAKQFPAFMEQASIDRKTMFRVRVGPEVDQKKAQQMRARIEKEFKLKGRLERYP